MSLNRTFTTRGQPKTKSNRSNMEVAERVGRRLRAMRKARGLSMRALAERSDLSVNTLSLIENGKTSPSVSTLQQLAQSLKVPITAFFEEKTANERVVYQKAGERQRIFFSHGQMENLGEGLPRQGAEPFITILEPGADSDRSPVVHTGREFVYCLEGQITYTIDGETYPLSPGDSILFDAYLPHSWRNTAPTPSSALLILCPMDSRDNPTERHFSP